MVASIVGSSMGSMEGLHACFYGGLSYELYLVGPYCAAWWVVATLYCELYPIVGLY